MLATVKDNVPRTTPVDFFNDGLTIWIAGEPGLKIRNIRSNPNVAVGMYHPMDHSRLNRSLQIKGKAKLINLRHHRKEFMARVKKFGIHSALQKIAQERAQGQSAIKAQRDAWIENTLKKFNLIRIIPDEITFLNIHPTKGMEKYVWHRNTRAR